MRKTVLAVAVLALALSGCGRVDPDKPESGLMVGLRAMFAFTTCASALEKRFGLSAMDKIESNDLKPKPTGRPGEWDVTFTADITEKGSDRVTRYEGVCHVSRDKPTRLDARFLKEIRPATDVVRRVRPG